VFSKTPSNKSSRAPTEKSQRQARRPTEHIAYGDRIIDFKTLLYWVAPLYRSKPEHEHYGTPKTPESPKGAQMQLFLYRSDDAPV
jgi:hypothetical protein